MTEATATAPERKPRSPRWRARLFDGLLIVAVYLLVSAWQERDLLRDRTPAPAFELQSLAGEEVSLAQYRGKRVLLHFWATWCGVCRREFSALNAVHAALGPDEVLVSIVADAEDPDAVRRVIEHEHLAYPVLLGTDRLVRAYRVSAFPTNYFVDPAGFIREQTVGMSTRWGLGARLQWAAR